MNRGSLLFFDLLARKRKPSGVDIQQGAEFIDIGVTVTLKADKGVEVQGGAEGLRSEGDRAVFEVVVAVNEHGGVLARNDLSQSGFIEVRQAEIHGSMDVAELELGRTAGIKNDDTWLGHSLEKFFFGEAAGLADFFDLLDVLFEAFIRDQAIGDWLTRRRVFGLGECEGNQAGGEDEMSFHGEWGRW